MDKYLKALIEVLTVCDALVVIKDIQILNDIQRQSLEHGIRIQSKRIPYDYTTQRGYIWQHQNSREYELSI